MKRYAHEPKHEGNGKLNPYVWRVLPLEDIDVEYFERAYEIPSTVSTACIWRTPWDTYLLPIRGPDLTFRGYVSRRPWDGAPRIGLPNKKAITFMHKIGPIQSYYQGNLYGGPTVIVEDQLSAIKVMTAGLNSWALLGVNMDGGKAREIQRTTDSEGVIFALDPDASGAAWEMARDWGLVFPKVRVALLDKDLKDTALSEIPKTLGVTQ
jgi:hypothetical protein